MYVHTYVHICNTQVLRMDYDHNTIVITIVTNSLLRLITGLRNYVTRVLQLQTLNLICSLP